ncbi:MAG: lipid-A-disaccharide synthase [Chthoniobacterales bacterium]
MPKTLYFVAGEASGDEHGAQLIKALREADPTLRLSGRGGPQMRALASAGFRDWVGEAGVLGLWEVVKRYGYFRREFTATLQEIASITPDAVVLIDYPGFNLRLARALREQATQAKIIYYISPQVWAWNRARIPRMARWLDLMLCIFPFEAELYNASGLRTVFVGHPMLQNLASRRTAGAREADLVGLFPGSRSREVRAIFPIMRDTATEMLMRQSQLRFEVAAASAELAAECQMMLRDHAIAARCTITNGKAAALMQRAAAGVVASGTATLEAAYFRLPFVLVYKVSWPTYLAARAVVNVKYLGMPNVLADREIVREFIQHDARPRAIAVAVLELLENQSAREGLLKDFDEVIGRLGEGDASRTAAYAILDELAAARA